MKKLSEKKKRRAWKIEAKKLAGQDMDKFLSEFDRRWKRLQWFFWLSFALNFVLGALLVFKSIV